MRARNGFTLIEVLIAVSLLGLLSVGILTTLRMGVTSLEKTNRRLIANRRVTGAQRALEQETANLIPVQAALGQDLQSPGERVPFFQGEPQSMRFVSSYSLQEASRGYPRILEFTIIPGDENRGVRLVVNEHFYTGPRSAGIFCVGRMVDPITSRPMLRFRPIETGPQSFVLADRLAYCRFLYMSGETPPDPYTWMPVWTREGFPRAIRVEMAPLVEDAMGLRPTTMTATIHVDRLLPFQYADF